MPFHNDEFTPGNDTQVVPYNNKIRDRRKPVPWGIELQLDLQAGDDGGAALAQAVLVGFLGVRPRQRKTKRI